LKRVKKGNDEEELVVPGETVAVIEEFLAGNNTYLMNGDIVSKIIGRVRVDLKKHVIEVETLKKLHLPDVNEVVYGVVSSIKDPIAFVDVIFMESRNKLLLSPLTGMLHTSNVSSSFVKSLYDVIGYGDIIRAWVIESKTLPLELSIKGREFGVIFSRCPLCLTSLKRRGFNLSCPRCRRNFKKKISSHYIIKK